MVKASVPSSSNHFNIDIINLLEEKRISFWLLLCIAILVSVYIYAFNFYQFVPVLGQWEHFTFFHYFGAEEAFRSWRISPRAIAVGQGYPLSDLALWMSGFWGWSLTSIRVVSLLYGLGVIILMIIIFSRWFGLLAATIGVLLTTLSSGFIFFSSEVNVMMPTLLLCSLLLERLQHYESKNRHLIVIFILGAIGAALMLHYAMGRFFFIGLLAFFLLKQIVVAGYRFQNIEIVREYSREHIINGLAIIFVTVSLLIVIDKNNFFSILDIRELFFPGPEEIEFNASNWLHTLSTNLINIFNLIFSPFNMSIDTLSFSLQSYARYPMLNVWHTPFLVVGIIITVRRIFVTETATAYPYTTILAMTFLTFGLALFSKINMFPITRVIIGYLPLTGFIVIGVSWTLNIFNNKDAKQIIIKSLVFLGIFVFATQQLLELANNWRENIEMRSEVKYPNNRFVPLPKEKAPKLQYMQARFYKLAELLRPVLNCKIKLNPNKAHLVQISPTILLDNDKYQVIQFLNKFNDLSPTLSLYLAEIGFNSSYIIARSAYHKGIAYWSHSYLGKPRHYSGPIKWEHKRILYTGKKPFKYKLKKSQNSYKNLIIIAFSDQETIGGREILKELSINHTKLDVIESLIYFSKNKNTGTC